MMRDPQEPRRSICIVSHNALGAIKGGKGGFIGGVEWQTALLARWLAKQGLTVSLITWNEGGPVEETVDGVRVLTICRQDAGLPGLRFFHPKWTSLVHALRKADADVYYHNCSECVTGQIALWCRRNNRRFVFSAASEADCRIELPEMKTARERLLYRRGIRLADRIIVQTETQRDLLKTNFGLASTIIPMPCPDPYAGSVEEFVPPMKTKRVLWIGRVCRVKRPDRLVAIARACPDIEFSLAGPIYDDAYAQATIAEARTVPNIRVLGPVPREDVPNLYRNASLLCCTSDYEGFPNTFLEAWSLGVPVVSTIDPDGVIRRHGLGAIGADSAELSAAIRRTLDSLSGYAAMSLASREYFRTHHALESVMPRVAAALLDEVRPAPKLSHAA